MLEGPADATPGTLPGTGCVKGGMAETLKGGVIMDVVTAAGPGSPRTRALSPRSRERVPTDIRAQCGGSWMSDRDMIGSIIDAVAIPVMAKACSGHFAETQLLHAERRIISISHR